MKRNFTDLLRKVQSPLILALGSMPIPLLLFSFISEDLLIYAWLFPVVYFFLAVIALLIPGKWRLCHGFVSFLVFAALGALAMYQKLNFLIPIAPILYGVLLFWSLKIAGWSWDMELHNYWILTGLTIHIITHLTLSVARLNHNEVLEPAVPGILISFFGFTLFSMLSLNRTSLVSAAMNRKKASFSMKRKNTLITVVFFVLALFIALIPSVVAGFKAVWSRLVQALRTFIQTLINLLPSPSSTVNGNSPPPSEPEQLQLGPMETSSFALILQEIILFVVKIVLIVIFVFLAYFLLKKLYQLLCRLWKKFGHYASAVSEDYEDIVTDTRESGSKKDLFEKHFKHRTIFVDERTLTPGPRIRHKYLRLLKKHPDWAASNTARKNLSPEAAALYERARYSDHPISEEDSLQFTNEIKHI